MPDESVIKSALEQNHFSCRILCEWWATLHRECKTPHYNGDIRGESLWEPRYLSGAYHFAHGNLKEEISLLYDIACQWEEEWRYPNETS